MRINAFQQQAVSCTSAEMPCIQGTTDTIPTVTLDTVLKGKKHRRQQNKQCIYQEKWEESRSGKENQRTSFRRYRKVKKGSSSGLPPYTSNRRGHYRSRKARQRYSRHTAARWAAAAGGNELRRSSAGPGRALPCGAAQLRLRMEVASQELRNRELRDG